VTSEGNPRLTLRLDPLIRAGLEARALSRGVTLTELAKFVLVEYVKQSAEEREGTPALLRHLDTLVRTLQLQATALTLPTVVEAPGPKKQPMKASKDTQQSRLDLHETVDAILKTLVTLYENEEAAKNAKARMEAMRLANITIRTDLAILHGIDSRDIQALLDEVRETNEQFKAQIAANQRGTKEASKPAGS
jgi:hypothetical protein